VRSLTAVADAQGNIVNTDFAPELHHLGVRFYLTAYGSQSEAQWTFTDNVKIVRIQGVSPVTATVTARSYSNNEDCTGASSALGPFTAASASVLVTNANTNGRSAKLTAAASATSPAGYDFSHWSSATNGPFTTVAGDPLSICVGGSNGNQDDTYVPNYVASDVDTMLALATPAPASVAYGSTGPVTLTATLTGTSGGVDGATINFTVGGSAAGTATTSASGVATLSYDPSGLAAGPHNVDAAFAGQAISGTAYNPSTGTTQTLTVTPGTPTVTFGAAPTPTFGGGDFTVSATTTNTDSGQLTYGVVSGPCALVSDATFSSTGAGTCVHPGERRRHGKLRGGLGDPVNQHRQGDGGRERDGLQGPV
jgi:hypothetical protein